MKLCRRGLNFIQVYDDLGHVRICGWTKDGAPIGNLIDNTFSEVFHSSVANSVRDRLCKGDYSKCRIDECPYLATGEIKNFLCEVEEIPEYPEWLYLAFENVCNYNCITCDIHEKMLAADKTDIANRYDKIENEIRKVLPYIKRISANGQGEVFACERTMRLLSEWEPTAPIEECSVTLETNGSLFDEIHWEKIKNIGKYHLTVSVTIMSFNEMVYQRLSGTKLPISQVEHNLKFIKSLREAGIINDLRLATVVQQSNFRDLPEFTRRCIEEYGADYVRLRSFVPWGKRPLEVEWFMDIRNPYHPDHEEYLEMMKHPIFKHPAVHDWSGGRGTTLGVHPDTKRLHLANKKLSIQNMYIQNPDCFSNRIYSRIPKGSRVAIYGVGDIGKLLYEALKDDYIIEKFIDRYCLDKEYDNIPIIRYTGDADSELIQEIVLGDFIMITPLCGSKEIKSELCNGGYSEEKIVCVNEVFDIEDI